jgi:hypothetical protein
MMAREDGNQSLINDIPLTNDNFGHFVSSVGEGFS